MARPQKTLEKDHLLQIEALAAYLTKEQIADYLGIVRNTFDAIMERQPEVFEHYKRGKARAIGSVAKNLIQQAQEGNISAAIFYLKTQAGWREVQTLDHTSSDSSMSPSGLDVSKLSTKTLEEIVKASESVDEPNN